MMVSGADLHTARGSIRSSLGAQGRLLQRIDRDKGNSPTAAESGDLNLPNWQYRIGAGYRDGT